MMALTFALLTLSLAALLFGRCRLAMAAAVLGLALSAGLFLYEIYSPEDGFRMPWLQVRAVPARPGADV